MGAVYSAPFKGNRMNILVVNDDGIKAQGIKALTAALSKVADVFVCAPDSQRSGYSHALTIVEGVFVRETECPGAVRAWETSGTPVDCTKIGIEASRRAGAEIDMVFAGINHGWNLGIDTHYSGTVGAAMEGAFFEKHSVAVSVQSHTPTHFEVAAELAVDSIDFVRREMPVSTILNINVPDLPREEIKGLCIAACGGRYFDDTFSEDKDGIYTLKGMPLDFAAAPNTIDLAAAEHGYAVISPLRYDFTDYRMLKNMENWGLRIRD